VFHRRRKGLDQESVHQRYSDSCQCNSNSAIPNAAVAIVTRGSAIRLKEGSDWTKSRRHVISYYTDPFLLTDENDDSQVS